MKLNKLAVATGAAAIVMSATAAFGQDAPSRCGCDTPTTPSSPPAEPREGEGIQNSGGQCHMSADFADRVMTVTADGRTEHYTFNTHPHASGEVSDILPHTTFGHCVQQSQRSATRIAARSGIELSGFAP